MTIDEKDDTKIDNEESAGLDQLVKEGEDIESKPKDDEEKGEREKEDEGGEGEDSNSDDSGLEALNERFSALEVKLDEKDAEITFLRGELKKRGTETREPKTDDDEFNIDEIAKQLSAADGGKTAAKTILELATKIADKKLKSMREETNNLLTSNQQIREAKETDRQNVLSEFGDYLDNKEFADVMSEIFTRTNRAAGRYIPDSLYQAASTAKLMIDKKAAAKNGTKNGVKKAPLTTRANPIDADTHDYSKVKSIDQLPATAREKSAMKGALAKMTGVTEKQYVENWLAENA